MDNQLAGNEILIVDDSLTTTAVMRKILEGEGYRVRLAHSGAAAIAEVDRAVPDLVLCDVEMPEINGFEVVRHLRGNSATARVPVVLVSARTDLEAKIRGLDSGATDYVTKPFRVEELNARIRSHLRVKKLQDEILEKNTALATARFQLEEKVEALKEAYQKIAENQKRTRQALDLAFKVQRGLLPDTSLSMDGFAIDTMFRPAEDVAGDFYDFIECPDGDWDIAIGDVAGKGVAASLIMVLIRTLLRGVVADTPAPRDVLAKVNELIIKNYGCQDPTTLFYGVLDPGTGSLVFANGGHEFPFLVSGDGQRSLELSAGGPLLGIFPGARYNQGEVWLSAGDQLTLFTDGVYFLESGGRKLQNSERLLSVLQQGHTSALDELLETMGYVHRVRGEPGVDYEDDITLIRIRCQTGVRSEQVGNLQLQRSEANLREMPMYVGGLIELAGFDGPARDELVACLRGILDGAMPDPSAGEGETDAGGAITITVNRLGTGLAIVVSDDQGTFHQPEWSPPDVLEDRDDVRAGRGPGNGDRPAWLARLGESVQLAPHPVPGSVTLLAKPAAAS